jgi:hypothetical protein
MGVCARGCMCSVVESRVAVWYPLCCVLRCGRGRSSQLVSARLYELPAGAVRALDLSFS